MNDESINLFLVEAFDAGITGVKRFIEILIEILKDVEYITITRIIEGMPINKPLIMDDNGIKVISIPKISSSKTDRISKCLERLIAPQPHMVFIINYLPGIFIGSSIRRCFPQGKIIQILHDMPWLAHCKGNTAKYLSIIESGHTSTMAEDENIIKYITIDMVLTFKNADLVVALCNDSALLLKDIYNVPEEKIALIPNGCPDFTNRADIFDKVQTKRKWRLPINQRIAVVSGRLSWSKGSDRLTELLADLNKLSLLNSWHFIYVGNDDVNKWIPRSFSNHVSNLGLQCIDSIIELYTLSDVGLCFSRHEQCSYTIIEMLMSGLPVIYYTGTFGIDSMLNGIGIPSSESINYFSNPRKFAEKSQISRMAYLTSYTIEAMRESYLGLLSKLY